MRETNKKKDTSLNTKLSKKCEALIEGSNTKGVGSEKKTRRLVIIIVSIFVGIAIILGAVLGIVAGVKNASYVMKLDSTGIDSGVASYLSSYFKAVYMQQLAASGVDVSDTDKFWAKEVYNGNTYADYLAYENEQYLRQVIAMNVIFDMYTTLTDDDKAEIDLAVKEILLYRSSGDKNAFNESVEPMGFDYNDFKAGTEILYKTYVVKTRIFGSSGENMASFPEFLEQYYGNYARVKLIFIRTQDTFVLDEAGTRVKDNSGNDTLRALTPEEQAERLSYIERLDTCIKGINEGTVAPEYFDTLAEEIYGKFGENINSTLATGYYFAPGSEYTSDFKEVFSDVVDMAFSLDIGTCDVIEYGSVAAESDESSEPAFVGRCYILKAEKASAAYDATDDNGFFSDYYSLAASALFENMVTEYAKEVELKEKWEEINPALIPYNTDYVARF